MDNFKEFESILVEEEKLLDQMIIEQKELRESIREKNWTKLVSHITVMNTISDSFEVMDFRRDEIQKEIKTEQLRNYFTQLRSIRGKLLRCKVENTSISKYVEASKSFIQEVINKALPQSRNVNYSRTGEFVKNMPKSVVVNQLF